MDKTHKEQVLAILDYWKTIEFLEQDDLPKVSNNKDDGNASKAETKIVTREISLEIDIQSLLDKDKSIDFPENSETIGFIYGKTERNAYAAYIEKFMKEKPNSPELPYPKSSAFGWFSFSTDLKGVYLKNSFQLSPLLWALSVWEKNNADKYYDFHLDISEYEEIIKEKDEEMEEKTINIFLPRVYHDIKKKYIDPVSFDFQVEDRGIIIYRRYKNKGVKEKEEEEENLVLADFGKSFFLNDIKVLYDKINANEFGQASDYERKVIDYILSAYRKSNNELFDKRTIISPNKERADEMRAFFDNTLNIQKAPRGKWPAKFMPALMQQVAVNLAIQKDDAEIPIFSVNGPPGTGKTTLLKEIVANNVVERAKLLAEYIDDPDTAFDVKSFLEGPLEDKSHAYYEFAPHYYALKNDEINGLGILVASCNNAAVENITVDLPKAKDILENLQNPQEESENIKNGLQEVCDLFDVEKSVDTEVIKNRYEKGKGRHIKDIYFTRYANDLLGDSGCWGLVSAPFGKKSNIRKYCDKVLKQFVNEYKYNESRELHKKRFKEAVRRFNEQAQVVEKLADEIYRLIDCSSDVSKLPIDDQAAKKSEVELRIKQLGEDIYDKQKKIIELEESWASRLLGFFKSSSTRKEMLIELKTQVENLKQEKEKQEKAFDIIHKCEKFTQLKSKYSDGENQLTAIDNAFMEAYLSDDEVRSTKAQVSNPWFTPKYNREREKLFLYACKVHKEFCLSSKGVMHNIINLLIAWKMHDDCGERMKLVDREAAMPSLLQTVFLLTPVISTTFASAQTFLRDIKKGGTLGTLIVDEAGQAQPQMAIGAMFRCRKAIIVGDPKQIEPVITAEVDMIKQMISTELLSVYKNKTLSVQGFADYINPYGTYLGEDEEREWVGCPLVVHRRCIDPMFTISNVLSYDGTMKQQTSEPKEAKCATFILDRSVWIQVSGPENGNKDHFVKAQGDVVLKLLQKKIEKSADDISLFIITPFTSVKYGMVDMLKDSDLYKNEDRIRRWIEGNNIGTVHTFQGKGTDEVIFLLGCDNKSISAANWVNKNIVNVAATRAKYRFYVIGDEKVWTCKPVQIAREKINQTISTEQFDALLGVSEDEQGENDIQILNNDKN